MRFLDRVQETTATTGTGTLTLAGAVSGFRTFASVLSDGDRVPYAIALAPDWEVGEGTYSAGTLSRDVVLSSSTGSLVSFSTGASVWIDVPATAVIDMGVAIAFRSNGIPQ